MCTMSLAILGAVNVPDCFSVSMLRCVTWVVRRVPLLISPGTDKAYKWIVCLRLIWVTWTMRRVSLCWSHQELIKRINGTVCGSTIYLCSFTYTLFMLTHMSWCIYALCNSLGSFGLTLDWCRCVSQVLVVRPLSKCRGHGGELWRLKFKAVLLDTVRP